MDHNGCADQVSVARYDDDYPLLYGEPAPQPQRKPARKCLNLPQDPASIQASTSPRPVTCRACGRCER